MQCRLTEPWNGWCLAGIQGTQTLSSNPNPTLSAGLHQLVVEHFNGNGDSVLRLTVTNTGTGADVSSSLIHDPAGPCNADCAMCNTAQQYCMACAASGSSPVGGVCTSPLSVTP